jgi:hypothetical protein
MHCSSNPAVSGVVARSITSRCPRRRCPPAGGRTTLLAPSRMQHDRASRRSRSARLNLPLAQRAEDRREQACHRLPSSTSQLSGTGSGESKCRFWAACRHSTARQGERPDITGTQCVGLLDGSHSGWTHPGGDAVSTGTHAGGCVGQIRRSRKFAAGSSLGSQRARGRASGIRNGRVGTGCSITRAFRLQQNPHSQWTGRGTVGAGARNRGIQCGSSHCVW